MILAYIIRGGFMLNASHAKSNLLTVDQVRDTGYSNSAITRAVKKGNLLRVAHGIYHTPQNDVSDDFFDDKMFSASLRFKQMVYSHDTALYMHDLNDRDPLKYSVTVPTGYNTKNLLVEGFKVFSLKKDIQEQDIEEIETMFGNSVRVYNVERTICDCLRSRNKLQMDIVLSGLKRYLKRSDRNLNRLMETAEKLKMTNIIKPYLEVLV